MTLKYVYKFYPRRKKGKLSLLAALTVRQLITVASVNLACLRRHTELTKDLVSFKLPWLDIRVQSH